MSIDRELLRREAELNGPPWRKMVIHPTRILDLLDALDAAEARAERAERFIRNFPPEIIEVVLSPAEDEPA